jgi:cell division protease FtsH
MPLPDPRSSKPGQRPSFPPQGWRQALLLIAIALMMLWGWQQAFQHVAVQVIPYSDFRKAADQGEVTQVILDEETVQGVIDPSRAPHAEGAKVAPSFEFRAVRVDDPKLVDDLLAKDVKVVGQRPGMLSQFLWAWMVPMLVIFLVMGAVMRRLGPGKSVLSVGQSRAKLVADTDVRVTFEDVAGCDEAKAELREVVEFLRTPDRFRALGAHIPKGVLLTGPPGTGKTLLARAVAGEAGVPFYQLSGSDFMEMFVGVGAARVRDLFEQAKKNSPCIVFIDELDAVGRQRGVHIGAANDEREQTLNQLLVEMDGFSPNTGVIVLAATNRPDVLDPALLRPGRFDRQVVVDAPDVDGRLAILKVHARGKPLAPQTDLETLARATPGFSGADLANVLNEASLLAARRGDTLIRQPDLEEAVEKVVAGPERRSRRIEPDEKRRVAFHEVGHALVSLHCRNADPVHKISIVPRGRAALGYTLQRPLNDQNLLTKSALIDRIRGLLGGRAAEEIIFGEVSTGAHNDLEKATQLARRMVTMFGMSDKVGLAQCATDEGPAFLRGDDGSVRRDCSEETARLVDSEVRAILDDAYRVALSILREHRPTLDRVAGVLLDREMLDRDTFLELAGAPALANDGAQPAVGPA